MAGLRRFALVLGGIAAGFATALAWGTTSATQFSLPGTQLTASDETGAARFGDALALSADGSTALIGGANDNGGRGAAWFFTRSGSVWTQQGAKIVPSDLPALGSAFGGAVALSSDGSTAVIAGFGENAAWVYTRSGSTWAEQAKLTAPSGGTKFGSSVALSADGTTALIGDMGASGGTGTAWVFTRSGSTWTEQAQLSPSDATGTFEMIGGSVSLSSDGNTALIGGEGDDHGGAAWIFTRTGASWMQDGPKLISTGSEDFGSEVAISGDGRTALVGDEATQGQAWVFTESNDTWSQPGTELAPSSDSLLGASTALSSDGTMALVGNAVEAWAFSTSNGTLMQGTNLAPSFSSLSGGPGSGNAVAVSGAGDLALLGVSNDNSGAGSVWAYTASPMTTTSTTTTTIPATTFVTSPPPPVTTTTPSSDSSKAKTSAKKTVAPITFRITKLKPVALSARKPELRFDVTVSGAVELHFRLLTVKSHKLAAWSRRAAKGTHAYALPLPPAARPAGHDDLRVTGGTGSTAKSYRVTLLGS